MDAYPFVKGGKELDVGLELFSSFFKCLEIWKEKRGMKKIFHRQLATLISPEGIGKEQIQITENSIKCPVFLPPLQRRMISCAAMLQSTI